MARARRPHRAEPRADRRELGNSEIGEELHISLSTVKTHLASIMAKLGARNRVEIAIWAHERGGTRG